MHLPLALWLITKEIIAEVWDEDEAGESSCVNKEGYDERKRLLKLEYTHGDVYCYFGVPPSIHREFLAAQSKGKFVNERIKKFPSKKVL